MTVAQKLLSGTAARAARRPLLTLAAIGVLALVGAGAALSLRPNAATDTLVGRSSSTYKATQRFYASFGEEPVVVVVSGDLRKLLLSSDIDKLVGLEGCLSGKLPPAAFAAEGGANGPCAQLTRAHTVKVVVGPGTFVNEAAVQLDGQLSAESRRAQAQARQARGAVYRSALSRGVGAAQASSLAEEASKATLAGFAAEVSAMAIRYGITAPPSLEDRQFVSTLVFESSKPAGTPKQRFAYLFPSRNAALVSVRLKAGLSESQRSHTISLIHSALGMSQWQLANGESYAMTGEPVIASEVQSEISHSIELLLIVVVLVMAVILGLVFAGYPRLLPLGVALAAAALTFGGMSLAGVSLTMASVAVLPVLVGLAVDYAIQFQSRVGEALDGGRTATEAVRLATVGGGPAIATAACACVAGLGMLVLSPVPMVRSFGVLLVVGVGVAFLCALSLCSAAAALGGPSIRPRSGPPARVQGGPAWGRQRSKQAVQKLGGALWSRWAAGLAGAWDGAREILTDNPLTRSVSTVALGHAVARPARLLAVGLALAALGWGLDTQAGVQTDIAKLAPQGLPSLAGLRTLERASGVGGELDLMVSSRDVATPSTISWMSSYQRAVLHRFGYSASQGCGRAQVCPSFSLPDLFDGGGSSTPKLTQRQVNALLAAIPPYFSQAAIAPDRRTATLSFGIRLMALTDQNRVIDQMRAQLHPPAGVHAELVGLAVLAAQSAAQVASPWRRIFTLLAALAAVALVLGIAFRGDVRRTLVPLVPTVLASGWSALALFAIRVPLNPMSVTLGALVIAISTEFSVLLCERHRQEMQAGYSSLQALRRAYRRTGAAVAASGATAIAGFGVLAFSNIAMLRDFGLATLVDLSVSLVGVFVALPAAIVLAQRKERLWARASRATSPSLG